MKTWLKICLLLLCSSSLHAQSLEQMEVKQSTSPDGRYRFRVSSVKEDRSYSAVELVSAKDGQPVGDPLHVGYGYYPHTADPEVLQILWAPDSKTVAVTTRGTKRTRQVQLCSLTEKGLQPISLSPGITAAAQKELGSTENTRSIWEKPIEWLDSDRVVIRATGSTQLDGQSVQYEVDVTCSVSKKSVISAKKVSLGPVQN